MASSGNDKIEN